MTKLVIAGKTITTPEPAAFPGILLYTVCDRGGELVIHHSTASGGMNYAQTNHLGSSCGVTRRTREKSSDAHTQDFPIKTCTSSAFVGKNNGGGAYYARSVLATGTKAMCISAARYIE